MAGMVPVFTRRQALQILGATLSVRVDAQTQKPIRGIFPIMATPFTPTNQVDYEDLAKEVEFMDRCGAHGMVWPQLASEYKFLTLDERRRGMRVLAQAAKGKRPALVLGVQGPTKKEALEYAELAEELSSDALIAIPPTEAKSLDDFRDYYRALARITHRPFFIQTSGGAAGINPTVEFLIEMGREFPHFGYVKEEHQPIYERIPALAAARPNIKRVFSGPVGIYEMRVGCDGCMPEALYPDIDVQMWDLYHSGHETEARAILSQRLLMVYTAEHIAGTRPYIMKKRGVFKHAGSRREKSEMTPAALREIDFEFEGLRRYLKV
jgi:dihydrodipicolinate synthase/N-acetylneuraminate lyase